MRHISTACFDLRHEDCDAGPGVELWPWLRHCECKCHENDKEEDDEAEDEEQ